MDATLENTIKLFNPWWQNKIIDTGIKRVYYNSKIQLSLKEKRVTFLLGSRRVGKTYLIFQTVEELIKEHNINPREVLFLSLDNVNLKPLDLFEYIVTNEFKYVFLDEVQYWPEWQVVIKSLYDLPGRSFSIICSGSSNALIQDKKALLTGRHTSVIVHPLSFGEFQNFSDTKNYPNDISDYMEYGGYPEYILERHPTYLTELLHDIVDKDIVEQYGIRRKETIFELLNLLAKQIGCHSSINKLAHVLGITDDTVKTYIEYLSEVYLISYIYKYSPSLNNRIYSPRKYYFWDTGLRSNLVGFEDIGSLAENLVYIQLRKNNPDSQIFYFSEDNRSEIDFLLLNKHNAEMIEVKYESFKERVISKLSNRFFGQLHGYEIKRRLVITKNVTYKDEINGVLVEMLPLKNYCTGVVR